MSYQEKRTVVSVVSGALLMLAFGLGTLPTLMAMGVAAARLKDFLQRRWVRRGAGLLVMAFGLLGLWRVM